MKGKGKMKMKKKEKQVEQGKKLSKKRVAEMSVDDMFSMIDDDDGEMSEEETPKATKQKKKVGKRKKLEKKEMRANTDEEEDGDLGEDEDLAGVGKLSQEEYLKQLKKSDPAFYATMMQSSEVLDMHSSDSEEEDNPEREGGAHEPPDTAEADSDESDAEEEDLQKRGFNVITSAMVTEWEEQLSGPRPLNAFMEVNQAFLAAIESLGTKDKEDKVCSKYKVEGSQIFNAIIRMCLRKGPSAILKILSLNAQMEDPSKCKKWPKCKNFIKAYLRNLVMLTKCMAEPSMLEIVLSHGVLPLMPYYIANIVSAKLLMKRLITLWATSEKKVRVLAFICIYKLCRTLDGPFLEWGLKKLYLAYVQNSKFTSASTWGLIDFMRISLVEVYALNESFAYKHAFVYVRQMAIHLRNAITIPKKEQVQLVYNWQYIHCLHLWADLLGKTHPSPALQPLIYPLTQVALGTMKLQPTPVFYPLVFHVCNILTSLSRHTKTFIPVLPFLLEVLNKAPLEKTHKKASIRPYDWMCMLRVSRSEMAESAFKDGVVEQVYDGIINYLNVESSSISFPELVVPVILQLKALIKKLKVPKYTIKMKQLLDKINENSAFIDSKRKEVSFGIADSKAVEDWEISIKQQGTPMEKHYQLWKKAQEAQHKRSITDHIEIDNSNLPTIKKKMLEKQMTKDEDEISDSDEDGTRSLMKTKNPKLKKKAEDTRKGEDEDDSDEDDQSEGSSDKKKCKETEDFTMSDIDDDGAPDIVTEMNFSDMESEEEVDDYGDMSD